MQASENPDNARLQPEDSSCEAECHIRIDNDLMRVTHWTLPPRCQIPWQYHSREDLVAPLTDGALWIHTRDNDWIEIAMTRGDALFRPFEGAVSLFNRSDKVFSLLVTEFRVEAGEIQASRARDETLTRFFEASPLALLLTGLEGTLLRANERAVEILGLEDGYSGRHNIADFLVEPTDRMTLLHEIRDTRTVRSFEADIHDGLGGTLSVLLSSRALDFEGQPCFLTGFADISEQKRLQTELIRLASTDVLTGSYSRRAFLNRAEQEFARSRRHGYPLAVLMIDADRFKRVNDVFGHRFGDLVLKHLTESSRSSLRENDVFGRIGGEEFAALLPDTSLEGAQEVGERLRKRIEASPVEDDLGLSVQYTISIGAASLREDDLRFDALLHRADLALYEAKENGRNRIVLHP